MLHGWDSVQRPTGEGRTSNSALSMAVLDRILEAISSRPPFGTTKGKYKDVCYFTRDMLMSPPPSGQQPGVSRQRPVSSI